jgi:predicted nuclease of predicted toxin-antitoxin system
MKVMLDTCVWGGSLADLRAAGHDVVWTGEWDEDPGDDQILASVHAEERVLVTLDKDFGEMAVFRRLPHHGIVRLVNFSARQQATVCLDVLLRHGDELLAGAIVTAELGRLRIRPADEQDSDHDGEASDSEDEAETD